MRHYLTGQVSKLGIISEGIRTKHRTGDTDFTEVELLRCEKIKRFIETDEQKQKVKKQDLGSSENERPHVDLRSILTGYLEISLERLYNKKYPKVINEYAGEQLCMSNFKKMKQERVLFFGFLFTFFFHLHIFIEFY